MEELTKAVKAVLANKKLLEEELEVGEFGGLIDGVTKRCVASLIEDFLWGE